MSSLLLFILTLQDAKVRFAEANERLNRYVWERRLELGDWCRAKGLLRDAVGHYRFVRDGVPAGHPYGGQADRKLFGSWKNQPDTADAATRTEHLRRRDAYVREAADRAFACYRIAKAGGLREVATQTLERVLQFDIDHPEARKERGEVQVDVFGWVPQAEEKEWTEVVRSEHFVMRTDRDDASAALDHLERVREAFFALVGNRFEPPPGKMGVLWFRNIEAFDRIRCGVPGNPGPGTIAFYNALTHVAYCATDLTTLTHEVVHGLADLGAGAYPSSLLCADRRGDAQRHYWVVEGLACYVATATFADGGVRYTGPPLPAGVDLAAFAKLGFTDFQKDSLRNYGIAHALTRALIESDRRERFLDFVRDFYDGRGDFARTVGPMPRPPDHATLIVNHVTFPSAEEIRAWREKGSTYQRVLDVLIDRSRWLTAVKAVEERLGPFDEEWTITVRLGSWEGSVVGSGWRSGSRGEVAFNIARLGEYEQQLQNDRVRAEKLAQAGILAGYALPPIRYDRIIQHELTHVLQGECATPSWLMEGLATWVADDPSYVIGFVRRGRTVHPIEEPLTDWKDIYPRGMMFFAWLADRHGRDAVRTFFQAISHGGDWKTELERLTKLPWLQIIETERAWSEAYVRKRKG